MSNKYHRNAVDKELYKSYQKRYQLIRMIIDDNSYKYKSSRANNDLKFDPIAFST